MVQIEDYDLPIDVAKKITTGTKVITLSPIAKSLRKAVTGIDEKESTIDMFDLEEIKEIADYLMVYYNSHLEGD